MPHTFVHYDYDKIYKWLSSWQNMKQLEAKPEFIVPSQVTLHLHVSSFLQNQGGRINQFLYYWIGGIAKFCGLSIGGIAKWMTQIPPKTLDPRLP